MKSFKSNKLEKQVASNASFDMQHIYKIKKKSNTIRGVRDACPAALQTILQIAS